MKLFDAFFKSTTGLILFGIFSLLLLNGLYAITKQRPADAQAAGQPAASPTSVVAQFTPEQARASVKASFWSGVSPYDTLKMNELKLKLPYETKNLIISFSDEVNQFLITLKNEQRGQQDLNAFLNDRTVQDIYLEHPSLFSVGRGGNPADTLAAARQNLDKRVTILLENQNVRGINVSAQSGPESEVFVEHIIPNQEDTKQFAGFFINLLKGLPNDKNLDAGTFTPGGGGSTPGGSTPSGPLPNGPVGIEEIVDVQGIQVHRSIATQVNAMLTAAKNAGLDIDGSGWRDPAEQIALRRQNCGPTDYDIHQRPSSECTPPTARPGTSNHERGLAIDFRCNGGTMRTGDACFNWMTQNAETYGFYNLPSESWHWSVDGR